MTTAEEMATQGVPQRIIDDIVQSRIDLTQATDQDNAGEIAFHSYLLKDAEKRADAWLQNPHKPRRLSGLIYDDDAHPIEIADEMPTSTGQEIYGGAD